MIKCTVTVIPNVLLDAEGKHALTQAILAIRAREGAYGRTIARRMG